MGTSKADPTKGKKDVVSISIEMDRDFSRFTSKDRTSFLEGLASIAGVQVKDIRDVSFTSGCTIFKGRLTPEASARLLDLLEKAQGKEVDGLPEGDDLRDAIEFLKTNKVTKIHPIYELRILAPARQRSGTHIVFVHGWSGASDSFAELPRYLVDACDCDASIYEYPTGWISHSPSINFISRNLDNWVRNNISATRLAFVAHSMGGLVVRKFIAAQTYRTPRLDASIRLAAFVASPHVGLQTATLGKSIPIFRSAQIDELSARSSFLVDLNEQWASWRKSNPQCFVRSVYGTADKVVPEAIAQGFDPDSVPILGAGHIDIVKPTSSDSEIVQTLKRFLFEAGLNIPTTLPTESQHPNREPSLDGRQASTSGHGS